MRMRPLLWLLGALVPGGTVAAALPAEVTVTEATRFEILTNGKPGGSVALRAGEKLPLVAVAGEQVIVRYRNLTGRVLTAQTDLPRAAIGVEPAAPSPVPPAPAPAPPPAATAPAPASPRETPTPPPRPAAEPRAPYLPASPVERVLAGKLVGLEGGSLRPRDPARLAGVKFYGLYFSAGWCGPCRKFTPELIDAYGKIRALYPEFEIVLVNRDKSPAEMFAYVREEKMPWPALEWSAIRATREITRHAGSGIPCLVLVDADGRVLSDSYRRGRYVGPDAVVDDTWRILREYRRTHPRPRN